MRVVYDLNVRETTLKFQIEHTARKKLTRLKKSTNHLARDTKIGHDIEAIDI